MTVSQLLPNGKWSSVVAASTFGVRVGPIPLVYLVVLLYLYSQRVRALSAIPYRFPALPIGLRRMAPTPQESVEHVVYIHSCIQRDSPPVSTSYMILVVHNNG